MRELELPNGKIAEFPDNTPDEVLHSFARNYIDNNLTKQAAPTIDEQPDLEQPKMSRAEAALTTGTNIPFAPRIKAGIAAAVASPFVEDRNFGELYGEALQSERAKLGQAREQYPIQSLATQLPADIATGGKILEGIGLAGQGVKSVLAGAGALGGLQAAGETKDLTDIGGTLGDVGTGALSSAGTAGLLKGAGRGYEKVFGSKQPKYTADDVKTLASQAYKTATQKGGLVKPEFIDNLINKASAVDKQTAIGKAIQGKSAISEVKDILTRFQGKKLDLDSIQELDEALGDRIDDFVENGVIKKAGLPLLKLQNSLRDMVEKATPNMIEGGKEGFEALKQGRKLWAQSAKLRDIEKIITRAEMSDNPATALKTGFRSLFSNPNRLKYFNQTEKEAIKNAAKSGFGTEALRTLSSRLIPIGSIVAGGGVSSALAGQVGTMAARDLATKSQLIKANKVAEQITKSLRPEQIRITRDSLPISQLLGARIGSSLAMQP